MRKFRKVSIALGSCDFYFAKKLSTLFIVSTITLAMSTVSAQQKPDLTDSEKKALKMYERLTGVKSSPDNSNIAQMASLIQKGNLLAAAKIATAQDNFLNITVKLMALEMSTRNETIQTPFNDMVAAFIGVTRDGTDARELLTGNFYYRGKDADGITIRSELGRDLLAHNHHYEDLENKGVNLAKNLYRVNGQQVIETGHTTDGGKNINFITSPSPDPAGVLTSRSFMNEHGFEGSNRRLVEFAFREFMCVPLTDWADNNATDEKIGRDIDRFPAGDHSKYLTSCKGCHTAMDGFRGAFAKWDVMDELSFGRTPMHSSTTKILRNYEYFFSYGFEADSRGVTNKMNKNGTVYPSGYVTLDDSFVNFATRPANMALFGWRGDYRGGKGAKGFGEVIANSRRFSQCMAKRAFKAVCRKELPEATSTSLLRNWGDEFEASGYKLKNLFENMAIKAECLN